VNPFEYGARQSAAANAFSREEEYNEAMVRACISSGVTVVSLTDHFRIRADVFSVGSEKDMKRD
jgi:predicted metal-dependent phosphoesterase TrpH